MFISIWLVSFVQAELVAVKEEFLLGIASRRYNQRGRNSKPMLDIIYFHSHPVFFRSSYGAPLAQRASYLALHSYLFGPAAQLIMIILSLTA